MDAKRIKYRLKFTKGGRLRFIGHLDLLNLLHRSLKRSGLPVAYSLGFNPHQETAFALPLSLGYYSNGEYVDIIFTDNIDGAEIIDKLNAALPGGIEVLSARPLKEGEKSSASSVCAALYSVVFPSDINISAELVENFEKLEHVVVLKKTKKKTAQTDIKPDILELLPEYEDGRLVKLSALLSAGAERSVRIDSVVKALYEYANVEYEPYEIKFIRENLFRREAENYISLE